MKTVAFIPSRFGSSRFPGKPLAVISGKPMIRHVYERAKSCDDISDVFVATDDERIFRCVEEFGGKAVMTRGHHPSGSDRVWEAASALGLNEDDIVVNIQGDQPAFDPRSITLLIAPLADDQGLDMSTLIFRMKDPSHASDPNDVKVVIDCNGFAVYFSRCPVPFYRDGDAERLYYKHLGFYAFRMRFLRIFNSMPQRSLEQAEKLEQLRAVENGYRIKVVESPWDSPEVDTPSDVAKIERTLCLVQGAGQD